MNSQIPQPNTTSNLALPSEKDFDTVDGVIQRITYVNEENGYTVAKLKVPRQKQPVTIAGYMPGVNVGEGLRIAGKWSNHAQYGRQFSVTHYQTSAPGTPAALKKYLASGLLKGVGPVMAEHLVNTFGLDTLEVLDNQPERLAEVPGLGQRKAAAIAATWQERRTLKDLMLFLQSEGLPVVLAARIARKYGSAAETIVRNQPYRLAAEVYGVSFQVADAIAARAGIARDSAQRLSAGLTQTMRTAAESGHAYLPISVLTARASRLLSLPQRQLLASLPEIAEAGYLTLEMLRTGSSEPQQVAYLPEMNASERAVATALHDLQAAKPDRLALFSRVDWETAWRYLSGWQTVRLTEKQQEAIRSALMRRVSIITGGPGTGKTTALRGIVALAAAKGRTVALAAPTGRAAKRLSEATGAPASTIHRLLELRAGGSYDVRVPLQADLVIIDEAPMMDLPLAEALVKAVPSGSHLVLVGDADQLPPVGPGAVFRDIIASGTVPTTTLETIFRQPEGSAIVANAHRINSGQLPETGRQINDFFFFSSPSPGECAQLIVDLATRRVPEHFGLDPMEDIQVLVPMYSGICGIESLNANLQAALNPPDSTKDERRYGNRIFRVGDKVMQVVNDYDRQVSNGELGRITRIDLEEEEVLVSFDSEWTVSYTFQELDELVLAYAISVHKAQGSEYPAVIVPILPQFGRLLQRNLLYTAVSRARQLVVLAGSPAAIEKSVSTNTATRRFSGLVSRLRHGAD